jgi:uncharacterized CHY-type Zn-finger protein
VQCLSLAEVVRVVVSQGKILEGWRIEYFCHSSVFLHAMLPATHWSRGASTFQCGTCSNEVCTTEPHGVIQDVTLIKGTAQVASVLGRGSLVA